MRLAIITCALLVTLSLAACGDDDSGGDSSAPVTTAGGAGEVVFPSNCTTGLKPEPPSVVVTCADSGIAVSDLEWRSWGEAAAQGTGTAHVNDCDPDCVAGEIKTYDDAQVRLSAIKTCGSERQYTRLELSFAGPAPAGSAQRSRQSFPCA